MSIGSRLALALILATLGTGGARAGQSAGNWTDPPARGPASQPERAPAEPAEAAPAKTAAPEARERPAPVMRADAPRKREARRESRREVLKARAAEREARRAAARAEARRQPARDAAPFRAAALPRGTVTPRAARLTPRMPEEQRMSYGPRRRGYAVAEPLPVGVALPPDAALRDPRLERLSSAEAAGYLVVRRRTVIYPDGRAIRIYRPAEEGDEFD